MDLAAPLPPAFKRHPLVLLIASCCAAAPLAHAADGTADKGEQTLREVQVTDGAVYEPSSEKSGAYTVRRSRSSAGLDLSLKETPQSVSVVTRSRMDDFHLNTVNDVLENTTGVSVERVETDRTYYTARGFDIINFQTDGIGVPFTYGNVSGDIDTAIYDRVEVLRGANGLLSATGNPSATVNFIRKRPTAEFQASAGLTVGSWNLRRLDGDISGPLNQSGTLRGRLVVAEQDKDSYLDRYSNKKNLFYGVLEADLSDNTTLTLGHSEQHAKAKSPMWGALPLYYTDGSPTNYARSTSTAADWAYWNNDTTTTFAELSHQLDNGWQAKAVLTRNTLKSDSALFYAYGTPDRSTGLGLFSYPSRYEGDNTQTIADVYASGQFGLGGRRHDLTFGASWSRSKMEEVSHYGVGIGTTLPSLDGWSGNYPEPSFTASVDGSSIVDRRRSAFAAARFNLADDWKLVTGARHTTAESTGSNYGESHVTKASDTTPYVGLIHDLTATVSAYASYTGIFNPQTKTDASGKPLSPLTGKNYELGVKSELFERRANASFALFKTEQQNLAEQAGYLGPKAYYKGVDANSRGYEFDLAGNVTHRLQAGLGYTHLSIKDETGQDSRTYTPRNLLRLSATYRVPQIDQLKVGATVNWQDATWRDQGGGIITRQPGYALVNLMARYDVSKDLSVNLNLYNVTDNKYLTSLYWSQAYYGAPMNGSLSLNWKY